MFYVMLGIFYLLIKYEKEWYNWNRLSENVNVIANGILKMNSLKYPPWFSLDSSMHDERKI